MGIQGWEEMMPDILERMIEYLIEENTLAHIRLEQGRSWSFGRMWMIAT